MCRKHQQITVQRNEVHKLPWKERTIVTLFYVFNEKIVINLILPELGSAIVDCQWSISKTRIGRLPISPKKPQFSFCWFVLGKGESVRFLSHESLSLIFTSKETKRSKMKTKSWLTIDFVRNSLASAFPLIRTLLKKLFCSSIFSLTVNLWYLLQTD